jgi:hypothetical protein
VEGGDQKALARLAPGPSRFGPGGSPRRAGEQAPVARPAHGLGPVARPVAVASRAGMAAADRVLPDEPARPAEPAKPRPMSPPIARAMRPAVALPNSVAGVAGDLVPAGRDGWQRSGPGALAAGRSGFGLPNLRRNVCPHFYLTGVRGAMPVQAPHLLKALVRQDQNVSRCQLRGGVHLEQGYVNDVCLSARFNQCVFYEDDLGS